MHPDAWKNWRSGTVNTLVFSLLTLSIAGSLIWTAFLTAGCAIRPSPDSSVPECVWRHLWGEPGATQNVNDAADALEEMGVYRELETIADTLFQDYVDTASTLPQATFGSGRQVPLERLPEQFHSLGGSWRQPPDVILRDSESLEARQLRLHWGNGRHAIVVFEAPPPQIPEGFYVRKVSPRTYVIANES